MRLKEGVTLKGSQVKLLSGLCIADEIWLFLFDREVTLTSLSEGVEGDGVHKPRSLHYKGLAADLRTRDLSAVERTAAAYLLLVKLGKDWNVLMEKDHIHIEYDPVEENSGT